MDVTLWPIDRVIPYARNPRKNDESVATVAASLHEFGWQQPLVVDTKGVLIVGHTRLKAARQLGMTDVPVSVAEGLTPAQVKAYRIMDNRSGERAQWDIDLLSLEIDDLRLEDFDLDLTGFTDKDLSGMFDEGGGDLGDMPSPEESGSDFVVCPKCGCKFDAKSL